MIVLFRFLCVGTGNTEISNMLLSKILILLIPDSSFASFSATLAKFISLSACPPSGAQQSYIL